jgi:hypothetical protein
MWVVRGYAGGLALSDDGESLAMYAIHELPAVDGETPAIAF